MMPLLKNGFTLIEILVATFIFTLVSMIATSALHTIFNSQSATEKSAAALTDLQIALLLLGRDIEQSINRPITNAHDRQEAAFRGTRDTITFTHAGFANPLGQLQRSTLQRTQYSIIKEQLIRTTWPVLDQAPQTLPSQRILLRAVTDLRFEYLDYQKKFQTNWPAADPKQAAPLPHAVRVFLTLKNWGTLSQLYLIPGARLAKPN
jgi:general secretion pathway protein J